MINKIFAKNLFSYSDLSFELEDGITGIDGYNYDDETPEGSGKSSIPNILCWTLFGQVPKDAKIDDVIKHGEKHARGVVELSSTVQIVRERKPNKLYILDAEGNQIQGKDAKETQKLICELLGFSYDTFVQAVYFAQNYPKKFITANEADKVKILSEILELDQFDKARKEVMELIKKEERGIQGLEVEYEQLKIRIPSVQSSLDALELSKQNAENKKKTKISDLGVSIREKQDELKELKKYTTKLIPPIEAIIESLDKDLEQSYKKIAKLEKSLEGRDKLISDQNRMQRKMETLATQGVKIQDKIEKLKNPKDKKCPMCKTVLESLDSSHFQEEIDSLQEEYNAKEEEYKELETEVENIQIPDVFKIEEEISSFEELTGTLTDLRAKKAQEIKSIEKKIDLQNFVTNQISELTQRLEKLIDENVTSDLDLHIKKAEEEKEDLSHKLKRTAPILEEKKAHIQDLEILKESYKEIKSYTFQNTLQQLSLKANNYLEELFNIPVELEFSNISDTGVSKILCNVTMDNIERPLGLYSGGQARRLQLAVDLALSDIIASRSNKVVNLRILDEYFKDLSEGSMQKALDLLSHFKGATIIIEHNTIFKSIMENVVEVELRNGTSTLCQ